MEVTYLTRYIKSNCNSISQNTFQWGTYLLCILCILDAIEEMCLGNNFLYRKRSRITRVLGSYSKASEYIGLFTKQVQWHLWNGSWPFFHPQIKELISVFVLMHLPVTEMLWIHIRYHINLHNTRLAPGEHTVVSSSPHLPTFSCRCTSKSWMDFSFHFLPSLHVCIPWHYSSKCSSPF